VRRVGKEIDVPTGDTPTGQPTDRAAGDPVRPNAETGAGLEALARRAEAVLLFERAWPPLAWSGAAIALFLAAPASRVMTGAIVAADAGYTTW